MDNTRMETFEEDKFVLHRVKFILFVVLQIPSVLISISIFLFFLSHRSLFHVRQNQALLLLLVINFIQVTSDVPMAIHFNYLGRVISATAGYCTMWTFLNFTLVAASLMLMATISIQRHILIFKTQLLRIRLYRYLLHHLPLLFCLVYPIVLYLIIVVFYPCDGTQWDFNSNQCGLAPCYFVYNKVLSTCDWAIDNGLPMAIIILANAALIVRVVRQKRRRQQLISWRKQRRMTLQLLSISCLYFCTWFPNLIIGVVQQLFLPTFLIEIQSDYLQDLVYLICLLLPWVCLGLFPEFTNYIWKCLSRASIRHNAVRPTHQTANN